MRQYDLILPICFEDCKSISNQQDPLVKDILSRQFINWEDIKEFSIESQEVQIQFENIALRIKNILNNQKRKNNSRRSFFIYASLGSLGVLGGLGLGQVVHRFPYVPQIITNRNHSWTMATSGAWLKFNYYSNYLNFDFSRYYKWWSYLRQHPLAGQI